MPLALKHQTPAQFVARFRERYRNAEKEEYAKMAAWLYDKYQAGDITATQIRNAFNLNTTAKWDTFRNKILALRDQYLAIENAKGE